MAVSMTADQFHALTQFRLDQLWPERSGRARMEVTMRNDQLQAVTNLGDSHQDGHRASVMTNRGGT